MHSYTKPEAQSEDVHSDIAFANLRDTLQQQQREINLLVDMVTQLAKGQGAIRDNVLELATRCSELTGVLTTKAFAATEGAR
jgi:hypothetical protein